MRSEEIKIFFVEGRVLPLSKKFIFITPLPPPLPARWGSKYLILVASQQSEPQRGCGCYSTYLSRYPRKFAENFPRAEHRLETGPKRS